MGRITPCITLFICVVLFGSVGPSRWTQPVQNAQSVVAHLGDGKSPASGSRQSYHASSTRTRSRSHGPAEETPARSISGRRLSYVAGVLLQWWASILRGGIDALHAQWGVCNGGAIRTLQGIRPPSRHPRPSVATLAVASAQGHGHTRPSPPSPFLSPSHLALA